MEVGIKIKKYLDDHKITQTYLSEKSGLQLPKLNLALNGHRRLTFTEYAVICGVLGLNTDYFLKPRVPDGGETREAG